MKTSPVPALVWRWTYKWYIPFFVFKWYISFVVVVVYLFIYLFLAALGLRCCARDCSSCAERGLLFVAVRGLLIVVASLVAEQGL